MKPIKVGCWRQVFIDYYLVEYSHDVVLRVNPPVKRGVVLKAERPWESHRVGAYGTVLEDGGVYKMWYDAIDSEGRIFHCYAVSHDGVNWEKPNLGLVEYEGSKNNNILPLPPCGTVFIDPHDVPERRYKYVTFGHGKHGFLSQYGVYVWWSSDGLRWTRNNLPALPFNPDTQNQAFWDERIGKYVAYLRALAPMRCVARVEVDDLLKPWPYKPKEGVSYNLEKPEEWPFSTTELPIVFRRDEDDPENVDYYNPCVIKYPFARDVYYMFPSAYLHFPDPPIGKYRNDGLLDIHIATSRDGVHWNRVSREPYVRLGREGEPDSKTMYMLVGMIRRGNDLWMYYSGYDYSHGAYNFKMKYKGAIFRLVQRLDGFTSLDAGYKWGEVITKPMIPGGTRLVLNADTSATGEIRVEALDEDERPISGLSLKDSKPIHSNSCTIEVKWRSSPDVSKLKNRVVRLRFLMRNAKLYSFQFLNVPKN